MNRTIDFSEYYEESKQDCSDVEDNFINPVYDNDGYLIAGEFNDDAMKTFLFECLDEEVVNIWHIVMDKELPDTRFRLIDFDTGYLHDDHEIQVKLSDSLIVNASVNIKFDINYYVNNPKYDDSGCYHDYKPSSVLIEKFEVVEKVKHLPAVA